MPETPRYLRFSRSLALGSMSAVVAACASEVTPGDGAMPDTGVTVADTGHVCANAACPGSMPANGTECSTATPACNYSSNGPMTCLCQSAVGAACGTFECHSDRTGPLNPPDLAV